MKLLAVTASEAVVAIFNSSRRKDAEKAAALVGGDVSDFGALNEFKSEAASLPKGVKAFYCFYVERSGKIGGMEDRPLLLPNGSLQKPGYALSSYATMTAAGLKSTPPVRKSYWRLNVACYADSEETAIELGRILKEDVFKKAKPNQGTL